MKKILAMFLSVFFIFTGVLTISEDAKANTENTQKTKDVVVVIDAGHGGADPGALATTGIYEKDCNLAIALAMKAELETYEGIKVYLTRSQDEWSTNTARAMTAAALNADFLISVHNNSGSTTNTGAWAYRSVNSYYSEATNDMCNLILENLSKIGLHNGGVQTRVSTQYDYEDYYTIIAEGVRAGVPSIIVEHCFLSNPIDATMLTDANGKLNYNMTTAMGKADATAVAAYFSLNKRTIEADNTAAVTLEKTYSVTLTAPVAEKPVWYSIDEKIVIVNEDGIATAVGSGTTNVVYKTASGATGSCTITVPKAEPIALIGAVDPTFYESSEKLAAFNSENAFGFVVFSDGTATKVKLDAVGSVDLNVTGVQDIAVKSGSLTGYLRIIYNNSEYLPEVTLPAETEPEEESTTVETTTQESETPSEKPEDEKDNLIKILKFVIVILVVLVIGLVIFVIESIRRKNRSYRRRRGRRRY